MTPEKESNWNPEDKKEETLENTPEPTYGSDYFKPTEPTKPQREVPTTGEPVEPARFSAGADYPPVPDRYKTERVTPYPGDSASRTPYGYNAEYTTEPRKVPTPPPYGVYPPPYTYPAAPQAPQRPAQKEKKKRGNTALIVTVIVLAFLLTVVSFAAIIGSFTANPDEPSDDTLQNDDLPTDGSEVPKGDTTSNIIYGEEDGFNNQGGLVSDEAIANAATFSSKSVVAITTSSAAYNPMYGNYVTEGAGSGVLWALKADENGTPNGTYIVTNNHVVEGATEITVTLYDGKEYPAALVGTDAQTDVAVLLIEGTALEDLLASIGESSSLLLGQTILAIGNPLGELAGSVTSGIISCLERDIDVEGVSMNLMQIDAAVNPGNSGGGLFNLKGQLVGIVNAKSSGEGIEGLGFAIPVDTVKEVAADIMQHGYVTGRPKIGINGYSVTTDNYQSYRGSEVWSYISGFYNANNGQILEGFYIFDDSSVSYVGDNTFENGDVLAAIGGTKIGDANSITAALNSYNVGDTVTITVWRLTQSADAFRPSGSIQSVEITVTLLEIPQS